MIKHFHFSMALLFVIDGALGLVLTYLLPSWPDRIFLLIMSIIEFMVASALITGWVKTIKNS